MKKILFYVWIFIIVCFFIPILFTKRKEQAVVANAIVNESIIESKTESSSEYNYGEYGKIKLLHNDDNSIEEIPIDEYLYGVVSAEMPADFEEEALKAQAIVARTYTIYKIQNNKDKQ